MFTVRNKFFWFVLEKKKKKTQNFCLSIKLYFILGHIFLIFTSFQEKACLTSQMSQWVMSLVMSQVREALKKWLGLSTDDISDNG